MKITVGHRPQIDSEANGSMRYENPPWICPTVLVSCVGVVLQPVDSTQLRLSAMCAFHDRLESNSKGRSCDKDAHTMEA